MYRVYVLSTDDRRGPRYVGTTHRSLPMRRKWHEGVARRGSTIPVARWILGLLRAGMRPQIELVAEVEDAEVAVAIESLWIAWGRAMGFELLNVRSHCYLPTWTHRRSISTAMRNQTSRRN